LIARLAAAEVRGAVYTLTRLRVPTEPPLFVAGGVRCDHAWLDPIRAAGYDTHCLPPTPAPAPAAPAPPSYHGAVVDQWVAAHATTFVGRRGSSFSWLVGAMRMAHTDLSKGQHEQAGRRKGCYEGCQEGAGGSDGYGIGYAWYEALPASGLDREGFRDFEQNFGFPPSCSPVQYQQPIENKV
jgi:hypothetical protein